MKNLFHIIFSILIALAFVYLNQIFLLMVFHDWLEGKAFTSLWGILSWLTLIEFLIFSVSGILAGLCITLLAPKEKAYFWATVSGILMILIYVKTTKIYFGETATFSNYAVIYLRSVMFLLGSFVGSVTVNKIREKLTSHSL